MTKKINKKEGLNEGVTSNKQKRTYAEVVASMTLESDHSYAAHPQRHTMNSEDNKANDKKTHKTEDLHKEHLHQTYKKHVNNKNTKLFRSTEHDTALPDIIDHCEVKNCNMHRPINSIYFERSNELNMKGAEEFFNTKNSQRDQSIVDNNSVRAFKSNLKPVSVENSTLDSPTETNHTYHKEEIVRESVYEINFF